MALFCHNMLEIAVELAGYDPSYDEFAAKFAEHFLWIAHAMNRIEPDAMWDEEDGFYYDVLRLPDGSASRLKVRSIVGLLPLCATTVVERDHLLFHEYFHGENGAGLGASHQTGWTGLVAKLIQLSCLDPKKALELGRAAAFQRH